MTLTEDQRKLKEAAQALGEDRWRASEECVWASDGDAVCACYHNMGNMPEPIDAADRAAFIAAANPAAILALLAQVEAAPSAEQEPKP